MFRADMQRVCRHTHTYFLTPHLQFMQTFYCLKTAEKEEGWYLACSIKHSLRNFPFPVCICPSTTPTLHTIGQIVQVLDWSLPPPKAVSHCHLRHCCFFLVLNSTKITALTWQPFPTGYSACKREGRKREYIWNHHILRDWEGNSKQTTHTCAKWF